MWTSAGRAPSATIHFFKNVGCRRDRRVSFSLGKIGKNPVPEQLVHLATMSIDLFGAGINVTVDQVNQIDRLQTFREIGETDNVTKENGSTQPSRFDQGWIHSPL